MPSPLTAGHGCLFYHLAFLFSFPSPRLFLLLKPTRWWWQSPRAPLTPLWLAQLDRPEKKKKISSSFYHFLNRVLSGLTFYIRVYKNLIPSPPLSLRLLIPSSPFCSKSSPIFSVVVVPTIFQWMAGVPTTFHAIIRCVMMILFGGCAHWKAATWFKRLNWQKQLKDAHTHLPAPPTGPSRLKTGSPR